LLDLSILEWYAGDVLQLDIPTDGLVTFRAGDAWRAGLTDGKTIIDLSESTGFRSVVEALDAGWEALDVARSALRDGGRARPVSEAELGPVITAPAKILCLGINYASHARETGHEMPAAPDVFAKFATCLNGPYADVPLWATSQQIDYEGEFAVVIGKTTRSVSEADALEYVGGYCVMNDVTARDVQFRTGQWTIGKSLDLFGPLGPALVPPSAVPDPQNLWLRTTVNGEERQRANTSEMGFPVARIIAYLSTFMTLHTGDVIATGTPAGVGFKRNPPAYLRAGDVVEVQIDGVGRIRNTFVT